jgi:hypothetical protein
MLQARKRAAALMRIASRRSLLIFAGHFLKAVYRSAHIPDKSAISKSGNPVLRAKRLRLSRDRAPNY